MSIVNNRKPWSLEDDNFLMSNYQQMTVAEIAKTLQRTPVAVSGRAGKLGLPKRHKQFFWSPEKDEFVRQNYCRMTGAEIAKHLGCRHVSQIVARAAALNVSKRPNWTAEEETQLVELFRQDLPAGKIAKLMGCSRDRVKNKLRSMGLKKGKSAPWTEQEIEILKQVYKHRTTGEIMQFLPGRPRKGIARMIDILGLEQEWEKSERYRELKEAFTARITGNGNPSWNPDREYIQLKAKVTRRYFNLLQNCLARTGMQKRTKSERLLGYTKEQLKAHVEALFTEGMSWETIHIDHIIPVKAFVENGITDPRIINHLSNLRPMFATENLSKSWKYDLDEFEAYMRKFDPTFSTHQRQLSLLSYEPAFLS